MLSAGQSIRKSIRRLPRMVAQLASNARSGNMGAYGASTNASDEFIVSKHNPQPTDELGGVLLIGGSANSKDSNSSQQQQNYGGTPGSGVTGESAPAIELIGNGLSSDLINPLCMVSLFACVIEPFIFSLCVLSRFSLVLTFCLVCNQSMACLFSTLSIACDYSSS